MRTSRGTSAPGAMDLGDNHVGFKSAWSPDRDLNPQYADRPDIPWCGLTIEHVAPDGTDCIGYITFDIPGAEHLANADHRWQVQSFDPLTVSPSVLCRTCGDHGFIRDGKWVRA